MGFTHPTPDRVGWVKPTHVPSAFDIAPRFAIEPTMNSLDFTLHRQTLTALPSGGLYHAAAGILCVSDLHLGKSDRIARRSGLMLPPYETQATLDKLDADIAATNPTIVICLGDSFDDLAAADALPEDARLWLLRLQAGRRWIWVEGNHDAGPVDLGGTHLAQVQIGGLNWRHIAETGAVAEVSGHYHPKLALPGNAARACFLYDFQRVILPAYGAYTGGLHCTSSALQSLFGAPAFAILTGRKAILAPMPKT